MVAGTRGAIGKAFVVQVKLSPRWQFEKNPERRYAWSRERKTRKGRGLSAS